MKMTRKFWSTMLSIVLLATMLCTVPVTAAAVFGDNLLAEEDAVFDGLTLSNKGYWGAWQPNNSTNVTVKPYAEDSDNSYLELVAWQEESTGKNATAALSKSYFEGKNIEKDTWYMVSYRYLSSRNNQGYIEIYAYNATSYVKNDKELKSSEGQWTTGTYLFKTAEDTETLSVVCGSKGYYVSGGTTTVCFDDFSIRKVLPDESGTIINLITGTVSEEAVYTAADGKLSMQLTSTAVSAGDTAVVSGYFTAAVGTEVEVKVTDVEGTGASVTKKYTGTGSLQLFETAGIGYNGVIEVQITGAGVTAEALSMVEDTNLLKNASFEDAADNASSSSYWNFGAASVKEDGDCPDGERYIYFEGDASYVSIRSGSDHITGQVGERFLFSVWYKTNKQARIKIEQKEDLSETDTNLGSNFMPDITLNNTNGEWRRAEITFEILPTATSFTILLRNLNELAEGEYVAYDLPVIQRIESGKLGFYKALDGKASKTQSAPYMTVLGQTANTAKDLTALSAIYVTQAGITADGSETVLLAVYANKDGAKQLIKTASAILTVPESGIAYPTAAIDLTDVPTGSEIRAFAWDSVSGMQPAGSYISTTN